MYESGLIQGETNTIPGRLSRAAAVLATARTAAGSIIASDQCLVWSTLIATSAISIIGIAKVLSPLILGH